MITTSQHDTESAIKIISSSQSIIIIQKVAAATALDWMFFKIKLSSSLFENVNLHHYVIILLIYECSQMAWELWQYIIQQNLLLRKA